VNSYTTELLKELDAAIFRGPFDENVHAIVITGKVEKFFSAGADHQHVVQARRSFQDNFALHGHEVLMRLGKQRRRSSSPRSTATPSAAVWRSPWPATSAFAKKEGGRCGLAEINLGVMPAWAAPASAAPGR